MRVLDDDTARARIADALDITLVVEAGAGTGKTSALVGRIVELVRTGRAALREIAAITFTEAAAAELRHRVRTEIERAAVADPRDLRLVTARLEVDDAAICTLHSFAQRILVEHCVAARIPPGFDVLDEVTERADFDARFDRFADTLFADADAEDVLVAGFSLGLVPDDLRAMAWELHRHWDRLDDGGLELLLRSRPAAGSAVPADPGPVLEAIDRALALGHFCSADDDRLKVHLAELAVVRGELVSRSDPPTVLQYLDTRRNLSCGYGQQGNWDGHIDEVRAACAAAEDARVETLRAGAQVVLGELAARLATFVIQIADERRVEGRLGFHDLLVHARRLLRADGEATAALRRRYRRLLVDEFQDTDPIQVELASRLVATVEGSADWRHADPGGLFVVGDPKQSIYRFRRADIESFAGVSRQLGETLVLAKNFRSVPGVLRFVNAVFAELFGTAPVAGQAQHHDLVATRESIPLRWDPSVVARARARAAVGSVQLTLDGIAGAEPDGDPVPARRRSVDTGTPPVVVAGGPIKANMADVRRSAARAVADALHDVVDSGWAVVDPYDGAPRPARWRDVAVLLPARTGLPVLEEALEDARIPYRLEGVAMLWGSDEVRDVLAVLRAADDPADHVAVLAALRSPGLGCGDDDLVTWHRAGGSWDCRAQPPEELASHPVARAMAVLRQIHERRWWYEPSEMVALVLAELHSFALCLAYHRPRDHWHRLRWLQDQARLFDETVGGSLRAFLRWGDLQAEEDRRSGGVGPPEEDDDAVRFMTVHGAKGLEFPVVVLAGLEREAVAGQQPPAVLWSAEGVPELRARRTLRTRGYDALAERERELDALERHRLLYVGLTRARDHLVICLHHKETASSATVGASMFDICRRNQHLWRRPSIEVGDVAGVADGDGAQTPGEPDRLAQERAPSSPAPPSGPARPEASSTEVPGDELAAWAARTEGFVARRHAQLALRRRAPVTTATAVAEELASMHRHLAPGPAHDEGTPEHAEAPWREADTALQIGRAVHSALAAIDLAVGTDAAGRSPDEVAQARAAAQGVRAHTHAVVSMVRAALSAPTVRDAAGKRHWRELFVAVPVGHDRDGEHGVLEGFIDLTVEDEDGLTVVDYKTDRVESSTAVADAALRHRPQLASYALAVARATGRPVRRCVLVFVADGEPREDVLEGHALTEACAEAERVARRLVGSLTTG
jgi:ATP-dependent helicase/nuclease subunit A